MTILWHKLFSKAKGQSPLSPQLLQFLAAAGGCPLLDAYRSTGDISPFLGGVDVLLFSYWSILLVSAWDVKNLYCRHPMASDPNKFLTTKYSALDSTTTTLKSANKLTLTPLSKLLHSSLPQSQFVMRCDHLEAVILLTVSQSTSGRWSPCLSEFLLHRQKWSRQISVLLRKT